MSVKTTDNTPTVRLEFHNRASLALRLMLDAIDDLSTPATPKRLGDLSSNKLKQVLGMHAVIQWRQRYAAIQEDVQHKHYTTPGTGPHFAEKAVKKVVGDAQSYFRRAGL